MKEATVIMATCQKRKLVFGIRAEKMEKDWHFTWAFPIDKKAAKREGYDSTTVKGSILIDNEYPGCPYCKCMTFVHCYSCSKISCWDGRTTRFCCPVCGNVGEISYVESFDNIKGGGY